MNKSPPPTPHNYDDDFGYSLLESEVIFDFLIPYPDPSKCRARGDVMAHPTSLKYKHPTWGRLGRQNDILRPPPNSLRVK